MVISKKMRERIWRKYGKHCAYCGIELELRQCQPDHIKPRVFGGTDDIENLNPSCRSCNGYKGSSTSEEFRNALKTMFNERINYLFRSKTKMDVAVKFGVVEVKKWDGVFYYERIANVKGM